MNEPLCIENLVEIIHYMTNEGGWMVFPSQMVWPAAAEQLDSACGVVLGAAEIRIGSNDQIGCCAHLAEWLVVGSRFNKKCQNRDTFLTTVWIKIPEK